MSIIKSFTNIGSSVNLKSKMPKINIFSKKDNKMQKYFEGMDNAAKAATSKYNNRFSKTSYTCFGSEDEKLKEEFLNEKQKQKLKLYMENLTFGIKSKVLSVIPIPTKETHTMLDCLDKMQKAANEVVEKDRIKHPQRAVNYDIAPVESFKKAKQKPFSALKVKYSNFISKTKNDMSIKRCKKREEKLLKELGKIEYTGPKVIRNFPF